MKEWLVITLGLAVIILFGVGASIYAWNTTQHDVSVQHGCVVDRAYRYFDGKTLHRSVVCP